jgi:hypothetical protein
MKNSLLVIGAVLLFASVAAASDVPTAETFLGYNLVRFNPNSGFIASFNANGETVSSRTTSTSGSAVWSTSAP